MKSQQRKRIAYCVKKEKNFIPVFDQNYRGKKLFPDKKSANFTNNPKFHNIKSHCST